MPKKTRKMKQRAAMRRSVVVEAPIEQEDIEPEVKNLETEPATAAPRLTTQERPIRMRQVSYGSRAASPLTFDYSHIYGDLRRIALFAGFFFAVLIVLSFVIK